MVLLQFSCCELIRGLNKIYDSNMLHMSDLNPMIVLFESFYLFSRPLTSFARQTQTDAEILPPRPAEAKTSIASRYHQCLCLKGMKLLPGQVAQAKRFYCPRIVCVCLRLKYLLIYHIQRGSSAHSIKFHQLFRR